MHRILLFFIIMSGWGCLHADTISSDSLIRLTGRQYALFPREKLYTMTDKATYIPGDTIWMRHFLTDASTLREETLSRYVYAELVSPDDTLKVRVRQAKDSTGCIYGYIPIPFHIGEGRYMLRCYTRYMQNMERNKFFARPIRIVPVRSGEQNAEETTYGSEDYHVAFYPEGGNMITENVCRVAFKVEFPDGRHSGVHGWVIGDKQDTVCRIQTVHQGMGDFSFTPKAGTSYRAVCRDASGKEKTFALPSTHSQGYALRAVRKNGTIYLSVVRGKDTPGDSLQIIAINRDLTVYAEPWESGQTHTLFPDSLFRSGVASFYLCRNGRVLSRRSLFVRGTHNPLTHIVLHRPVRFEPRKEISLEMSLKDKNGQPLSGTAALAVTDAENILPDSLQTICSGLLLSSDIKGPVEDPAWYFRTPDTAKADYCLDLLMRIQAWCRYDMEDMLQGKLHEPAILPEASMSIRGRVSTRVSRKAVKNASVSLHVSDTPGIVQATTDEDGRFEFNGFEFPDSTRYMLSAERKSGSTRVVLETEAEAYPSTAHTGRLYLSPSVTDNMPLSVYYAEKAVRKMTLLNGIRNYYLADIHVTARKPKEYLNEYERMASISLKEDDIRQSGIQDLRTYIRAYAGVDFRAFRGGRGKGALLVLDDNPMEGSDAAGMILDGGINKDDVQQIDILKGIQCVSFFGAKYNLIISITTKRGEGGAVYVHPNFGYVTPLGVQKPVEFYSPHYGKHDQPDRDDRTTLYWNPKVTFRDGKATVTFHTADTPANYTAVVEGITSEGEPFSEKTTLIFSGK